MHRPRTRRSLLTAVAAVATTRLLGFSPPARASAKPSRVPGYDSRPAFRAACVAAGGAFQLTGLDETTCAWPDGSVTVCDGDGGSCRYTPAPGAVPIDLNDNSLKGEPTLEDEPDAPSNPDDVDVPGAPDPIAAPRRFKGKKRRNRRQRR